MSTFYLLKYLIIFSKLSGAVEMTTFDIIKSLAEEQKISVVELEEKLDFSRNSLYAWKRSKPSVDKLQAVADYFHVSTDYLLGRTNSRDTADNDHIDVEDLVNDAAMLTSRDHALSDEDRDAIRAMLAGYLNSKEGQRRLKKYGDDKLNGK